MTVDEPGAIPMFVDRQRVFIEQNDHIWLCIHKTASGGSAEDIATFFAHDPAMASSHYVVGQDGTIVQVVQEIDGAAANCCLETGHASFLPLGVNLNVKTVSIEHVDPAPDNSTPLTEAQQAASFRLIKDICNRHNIPMRRGDASGGIIGHSDIAPLSRARCPNNYPWDALFAYLNAPSQEELPMEISLDQPAIAAYFEAVPGNSQQWKCKQTGKTVQYGILAFYRGYGNAGLCGLTFLGLPVSNEIAIPGYPSCVKQYFERGVLCYDPNKQVSNPPGSGSVYPLSLYVGPGQDPLVTELQGKVDALTKQLATPTAPVADPRVAQYADKLEKISELAQEIVPLAKP